MNIDPNDGFPQKICKQCKEDVQSASLLRIKSQTSDIELKNLRKKYENTKTEIYTTKIEEIHTELADHHDICIEINNSNPNMPIPEIKIEIQCDSSKEDGVTTWRAEEPVKKLSRKEKRQRYLDLVEGKLDPCGPVKCRVCKKSVSKWSCFISHAKLHLGFNFMCEFCGKSFISTTQLKRHCRSYHGMERDLQCKHCSYLALDNAQLKVHTRRQHTFERPYVCDTCSASYHSRRCLVQHLESHRTVATVQCDQCPQVFKSSRQLSRHRYRTHSLRVQAYKNS
ncbi:zinc finger and SCAN domain-containing protein 31-like isoform X2 [Trichoplusia ni]|uniref:Zinc finger and SCAN domain-containing protein 31-like isoform X2 n=1 Tax=Trichoplusia ni TaxID=7111 RepID=A0A7E5X0F8_TRINI|nr:zinc finger and SCAN domain-containing protein 31-like isoform X2 [Trichoplusia ni]XP_026746649.1 zinc finger and SCAN domain-containing protein 31-like isoform X2 [Trichoplusia ni]